LQREKYHGRAGAQSYGRRLRPDCQVTLSVPFMPAAAWPVIEQT
jgi:hypothetical protein